MASTFDVEQYENMIMEQESETKVTPFPEGQFEGMIQGHDLRGFSREDSSKSLLLTVNWLINDPPQSYLDESGNDEAVVRQQVWINLTSNGSVSYKGDNAALGRLREVLGYNKPGQQFNFGMLDGSGPALLTVAQRTNAETGDVYSNVVKCAPVS